MRVPVPGRPDVPKSQLALTAQGFQLAVGAGHLNRLGRRKERSDSLGSLVYIVDPDPKEPVHGRAGATYTCTSIQGGH